MDTKRIHDAASAQRVLAHVLATTTDSRCIHQINRAARERMIESARRDANERLADLAGTFPQGSAEFQRAANHARAVGQAHLSYDADVSTLLRWANEWDALVDGATTGTTATPVIVMDLSRSTEVIHADLRARWPHVVNLHWELSENEKTGEVWDGAHVLAKLQHAQAGMGA
jgi:hypothetical protein